MFTVNNFAFIAQKRGSSYLSGIKPLFYKHHFILPMSPGLIASLKMAIDLMIECPGCIPHWLESKKEQHVATVIGVVISATGRAWLVNETSDPDIPYIARNYTICEGVSDFSHETVMTMFTKVGFLENTPDTLIGLAHRAMEIARRAFLIRTYVVVDVPSIVNVLDEWRSKDTLNIDNVSWLHIGEEETKKILSTRSKQCHNASPISTAKVNSKSSSRNAGLTQLSKS